MKNSFLFIVLLLATAIDLHAQTDTIALRYTTPDYADPFLKNLCELQNVSQLGVTLSGKSLSGRKFIYRCHRVLDGSPSIVVQTPRAVTAESDSIRLIVGTRPINSDSVFIALDGPVLFNSGIAVATDRRILMETYSAHPVTVNDTIPVMAYTTGIPRRMNFDGKTVDVTHYCGLRDARVHPLEWYEKYGIKDFIYYDVIFLP